MNRRDFIRSGMLATGAMIMTRRLFGQTVAARVVQIRGCAAAERPTRTELAAALDTGLSRLLQKPPLEGWKSLFKADEIIGLKVNALAGRGLSTRLELAEAVCDRLMAIGVPPHHLILFDRLDQDLLRAGYTLQKEKSRRGCYGNNYAGYSDDLYEFGSVCSRISTLVTEVCTSIINLPILKDHGIVGVSGGLKNLFGLIDNPNKYHDQCGNPYVADVAMLGPIRNKIRLTICDGLTAQYEGGPPYMPQWTWPLNSLLLATDMVAMDRVIWKIIEDKRKEKNLATLRDAGREPRYILTAADAYHGLGQADLTKIDWITV